jgi:hypothetical protein
LNREILATVFVLLGINIFAAGADYNVFDSESPRAKIDSPRWQYGGFGMMGYGKKFITTSANKYE